MNSKMTTNSQLSTTECKTKQKQKHLSKQLEQEQIHRNEITWRVIIGRENVRKGQGNKKHKL